MELRQDGGSTPPTSTYEQLPKQEKVQKTKG